MRDKEFNLKQSIRMRTALLLFLFLFVHGLLDASGDSLVFDKNSAVVWSHEQLISGIADGVEAVQIHHNESCFLVHTTAGGEFSFNVTLKDSVNQFIAVIPGRENQADTLTYILGCRPKPLVKPVASVKGDKLLLSAQTLENPLGNELKYFWTADDEWVKIANHQNPVAYVESPATPGIYYFNLLVVAGTDSVTYKTMAVRKGETWSAFNVDEDPPYWMNDAVIYEITPYSFVKDGGFEDILNKLPELSKLGVNTIWLQPVYQSSAKGQGYDVTDYFKVNPEYGTEAELKSLIATAKRLGMRVLFDMVLNHTSIRHPYALEAMDHGERSHYYEYYQRNNDGKPYSSLYNMDSSGFVTYFWKELPNLNYDNEEVQRWAIEICKYWVREFDIDGYRFDAIWGVNARAPEFALRLRTELKSIKPDLLMLAEDKGAGPGPYARGFDAAYPWTSDTIWVSQWTWQYDYHAEQNLTVFNYPEADERDELLEEILFESPEFLHRQMQFLENNDHSRFIVNHDPAQAKMAAQLIFALPGIPMLYNGQETGFTGHPYQADAVFSPARSIQSMDRGGWYRFYRKLIRLRNEHDLLKGSSIAQIPVTRGSSVAAFHRGEEGGHIMVTVNMGSNPIDAVLEVDHLFPGNQRRLRFKDLLSGRKFRMKKNDKSLTVPLEGYSVRWLKRV